MLDQSFLLYSLIGLNLVILPTVLLVRLWQRLGGQKTDRLDELGQEAAEELNQRTASAIHQAVERANQALVQAALEGIEGVEVVARHKLKGGQTKRPKPEIAQLEHGGQRYEDFTERLKAQIASLEKKHTNFLQNLETTASSQLSQQQETLSTQVQQATKEAAKEIDQFTKQLQKRLGGHIDEKLGEVDTAIEEYKKRRLALVDEQIVALLERTLELVVKDGLSLSEKTDLVIQSLEQAKSEGFYG